VSVRALRGRRPWYLARRAASLCRRYGLRNAKAMARVRRCAEALAPYDLMPTFATPGRVIESEPAFFRDLERMGVELAVHGYDHVDFRSLSLEEARRQFERAADAFSRSGISFDGFRCPYLSYTDNLADIIPGSTFEYSSNTAISWDLAALRDARSRRAGGATYAQLEEFYSGSPASEAVSTPRTTGALVEIPVSLPDDLQLLDGVRMRAEPIRTTWLEILDETHRRGELFAPLFHPESFDSLRVAVVGVAQQARELEPAVWTAQLRDIARWWKERSTFAATTSIVDGLLRIELVCCERATVLARDWPEEDDTEAWEGRYGVLSPRSVRLDPRTRPFVGISGAGERTVEFLREQGYLLDLSAEAQSCTVCIDETRESDLRSEVQLLDYIESTQGPLLKLSRWPDGTKSALCFAGDLDALSLRDYAARFIRR
jgi:Polysaccharide deacetylase